MENRILTAALIKESASKGEIESLYVELYNFLGRFKINEAKLMGQTVGTQITRAFDEAFNLSTKDQKDAFKKAMIDQIKKLK
jgi:hypothetical protein